MTGQDFIDTITDIKSYCNGMMTQRPVDKFDDGFNSAMKCVLRKLERTTELIRDRIKLEDPGTIAEFVERMKMISK